MRVLLCDDHPVFRDGMRLLLTELGHDVVGEAATGEEAVTLAEQCRPDVVVMDLHLPGMSGVEATRAVLLANPAIRVLVLTMVDDDATILAALRAGARGYLLKGAGHTEVDRAIAAVAAGDLVVGGAAAGAFTGALTAVRDPQTFPQLSRREHEILELMARGRTNEQIASALFLSSKTVRNNVSAIFAKLGVPNRGAAIAQARDAGLGAAQA